MFVTNITNINTFCQFSLHLSNLTYPCLSLFFFMVFLVLSCVCISKTTNQMKTTAEMGKCILRVNVLWMQSVT